MKFLIILILIFPLVTSLEITKIELNPEGKDTGKEWIEFYSENEIDLSKYKIYNNDEDFIQINKTFENNYKYYFEKQFLDNTDEKIFIYKNNKLIFESDLLEDNFNDDYIWIYCNNEWIFDIKCDEEIKEEIIKENIISENESFISEPIILETISLNPQTIKSENDVKILDKNKLAINGLVIFCFLLLFLMIKSTKKQNEFR